MNFLKKVFCICLISFFHLSLFAKKKIYIKVGEARKEQTRITLSPFSSASKKAQLQAKKLYFHLKKSLKMSSYFKLTSVLDKNQSTLPFPIDQKGFYFKNYSSLGVEFLIKSSFRINKNKVFFEPYVYHVPKKEKIFSKKYKGKTKEIRKIAALFVDDLLLHLTGKKGFLNTKIVFVSNRGDRRYKSLYIMNLDGSFLKKISTQKTIYMSPNWSKSGDKISYSAYVFHKKEKLMNPDLFIYDLKKKEHWLASYRKGINSGSVFFKSGKHLLLTLTSKSGSPDIYRIKTNGSIVKRITKGPYKAMNVEPDISPNEKLITFSSDRSGRPMIYTADIDGKNVKRITYAGKYNSTPRFSPDGQKIVFAGYDKNKKNYDLFVMNKDGSNLKRITSYKKKNGRYANHESPSFSPDGRFVMFTSDRTGRSQIYIISVDGRHLQRITFDSFHYFSPRWSPYLD